MFKNYMYAMSVMCRYPGQENTFINSVEGAFSSKKRAEKFVKEVAIPRFTYHCGGDSPIEIRYRIDKVPLNCRTSKSFHRFIKKGYSCVMFDSQGRRLIQP